MFTIKYTDYVAEIRQHLSIIGKRAKDSQGNNIFSSMTLSTAEEPIFQHYVAQAVGHIVALSADFTISKSADAIKVSHPRWQGADEETFHLLAHEFIIASSVAEFLGMSAPDYAKKYFNDADTLLSSIRMLLYAKMPSESSAASYGDVTGSKF